jgi:hypothetical protein
MLCRVKIGYTIEVKFFGDEPRSYHLCIIVAIFPQTPTLFTLLTEH